MSGQGTPRPAPYLRFGSSGKLVIGAQAAGAQGHPAEGSIDGEGRSLDVGHEAGFGPPLGVAHVISGVSCLATQLALGHIFPLGPKPVSNGGRVTQRHLVCLSET